MRILAFDCAGARCAAAIVEAGGAGDGETLASAAIESERGHAVLLVPLLLDLLRRCDLAFADIDRFAVTTGPGSFTGIRVALATVRGLAMGTGKPAIGVSAFDVLAASAARLKPAASRILVALESRRAECYFQIYDAEAHAAGGPVMLTPETAGIWAGPAPIVTIGDAAWRLTPQLGIPLATGPIDPVVLARLAATRTVGAAPAPFYLRPPDAIPSSAR